MLIDHKDEERCIVIDGESYYPFLNCTYVLVNTWNYKTVIFGEYRVGKNSGWYLQNNREEYGWVAHRNINQPNRK